MPELIATGPLFPVPDVDTTTSTLVAGVSLQDALLAGRYPPNGGNVGLNLNKILDTPLAYIAEPYRERFRSDGEQELEVSFDVPWSTRKVWVETMLGSSTTTPGSPPRLTRSIPMQCPVPTYEHLYCVELQSGQTAGTLTSAGFLAHGGDGTFQAAADGNLVWQPWLAYKDPSTGEDGLIRYTARFRPLPFTVLDDATVLAIPATKGELERYVERRGRPALQSLPLPTGSIKWGKIVGYDAYDPTGTTINGATIPDNAAFLLMPTEELHYTWYQVPDVPWDALKACAGSVNNAPFDGARGGWRTYPRGTLLMQPPAYDWYRHPNGRIYWKIVYSFLYRPTTWQALPNAADSKFYTAVKGDGSGLYGEADFSTLFQPPAPATYQ